MFQVYLPVVAFFSITRVTVHDLADRCGWKYNQINIVTTVYPIIAKPQTSAKATASLW